ISALVGAAGMFAALSANAAIPMATGADVVPPAGFLGFCVKHISECVGTATAPVIVDLTAEREHEPDDVQAEINSSNEPAEDPGPGWDYPVHGQGDCNKFALAKRRSLIEHGWPRGALLLTTAITEHGEGHLVLVVRTNRGDLVLDNRLSRVV